MTTKNKKSAIALGSHLDDATREYWKNLLDESDPHTEEHCEAWAMLTGATVEKLDAVLESKAFSEAYRAEHGEPSEENKKDGRSYNRQSVTLCAIGKNIKGETLFFEATGVTNKKSARQKAKRNLAKQCRRAKMNVDSVSFFVKGASI